MVSGGAHTAQCCGAWGTAAGAPSGVGWQSRQLSALSDAHDRCHPSVSRSPRVACQLLGVPWHCPLGQLACATKGYDS